MRGGGDDELTATIPAMRRGGALTSNTGGLLLVLLAVLVAAGPWYLGAFLAVQFGADNPSATRTLVGWLFELPWIAVLVVAAVVIARRRAKYKAEVAAYNAVRPVPGPGGSTVYHHGGCTINHKTAEAAQKCTKGLAR